MKKFLILLVSVMFLFPAISSADTCEDFGTVLICKAQMVDLTGAFNLKPGRVNWVVNDTNDKNWVFICFKGENGEGDQITKVGIDRIEMVPVDFTECWSQCVVDKQSNELLKCQMFIPIKDFKVKQ